MKPRVKKALLLTERRSRFIIKRIIVPVLAAHFLFFFLALVRNSYIKDRQYAAILVSDYALSKYDYWVSPVAFLGGYPYITFYFNNRGLRVEWFLRATSRDLNTVIKDTMCKSIVLAGHGSLNTWRAVDELVNNDIVEAMMRGVQKKNGEWIQLTCGVQDSWPVRMGELVMAKGHVYTYYKSVNSYSILADVFTGFKFLKSTCKNGRGGNV